MSTGGEAVEETVMMRKSVLDEVGRFSEFDKDVVLRHLGKT